ncbi:hypothetical protein G210_5612 [Candida maltosa Xu316]|uniref:Uncharacterized protein n=1 Tax=Candida maltosa (strain Xu316) TaxID=1245528 RepID=M3K6V1_CANMX|nr:hypothetical protein G210_5612 [Candida maltosa Xu316]
MDVRRCRRCKRKRLDDEPEEVRQYKTCAKCRIIERNKKNSRKPLAEETMLYGLKQFREQQSTENYIEEEGLLKDEFFKKFHNKPFNYDVEIAKVLNNPNYVPPVIHNQNTDEIHVPNDGTTGPKYQMTMKTPSTNGTAHVKKKQNQHVQQQQQQQHQRAQQHANHQQETAVVDDEEDLYNILSNLGNKDEVREGAVISTKNLDPYLYQNVFDDFQKYLTTIREKLDAGKQINNLVFLKEFNEEFTINMSKFDAYTKDRDSIYHNLRLNERQFRSHLLSNIRALYIDTIVACSGLLFKQEYSNLNDFKSTTSIKCGLKVIPNTDKKGAIDLLYNRKYNLLIIRFNETFSETEHKQESNDTIKQDLDDIKEDVKEDVDEHDEDEEMEDQEDEEEEEEEEEVPNVVEETNENIEEDEDIDEDELEDQCENTPAEVQLEEEKKDDVIPLEREQSAVALDPVFHS